MFEKYLFRKAKAKIIQNKEQEALEVFAKLMNKKKATIEMKVFYAFYLMKNGDFAKARYIFDKLIFPFKNQLKKAPLDTKVQVEQNHALLLWKEGNLDEAISITERILEYYKNTVVYGNLGYFYVLKGDAKKALELNKEAYEFSSDDAVILDNLAFSYYMSEDFDKAEEIYIKMHQQKKPSFPEGYYNYGLVMLKKGDKEKAKELFEEALLQKFSYLSDLDRKTVEDAIKNL